MSSMEAIDEDKISQLPDAVICHILSFVPIRNVVQTTVLSKRWNNVWISIPSLELCQYDFGENFRAFVDGVLSRHASSTIQKFRMSSGGTYKFMYWDGLSCYSKWMRKAMLRNIVELDLQIFSYKPSDQGRVVDFELPESFFSCKTLVSLKVESNCISLAPHPWAPACFPNLKSLHYLLDRRDAASILQLLASKCPVLENLTVDQRVFRYVKEVGYPLDVPAAELKSFRIEVVHLRKHSGDKCKQFNISVSAPKLESFVVSDRICSADYYFSNDAKSVVKAIIHFIHEYKELHSYNVVYIPERNKKYICDVARAPPLLQLLSGVEYLSLFGPEFSACSLPWFNNLKRLEVGVFICSYWGYVMELLHRSPNLEELVLDVGFWGDGKEYYAEGYQRFIPPEDAPECLSSKLKAVSFLKFKGCTDELDAMKYFLRHSKVLRRLHISADVSSEKLLMKALSFRQCVSNFWKCSKACELIWCSTMTGDMYAVVDIHMECSFLVDVEETTTFIWSRPFIYFVSSISCFI